jgi:hypothetical protein
MTKHLHSHSVRRVISVLITVVFLLQPSVYCQDMGTARIFSGEAIQPALISAVSVIPNDPLRLDFYIEDGDRSLPENEKKVEFDRMIKYFFAALTIPEQDVWVNLSPYEQDRMIKDRLGLTDMGRDLLSQDYLLKQMTASLINPDGETGKKFWDEVYRRVYERFGTTDIPLDAFNKVWIMPLEAEVYEEGASAIVTKATLKVLLEEDYVAASKATGEAIVHPTAGPGNSELLEIGKQVAREILIPVLEREINQGEGFAKLRQIYRAIILATWYKQALRDSFLGKDYADRSKVLGIEQKDPTENLRIYQSYVEAFRKGAYNFIKEDIDRNTGELIPRKYFSGGVSLGPDFAMQVKKTSIRPDVHNKLAKVAARLMKKRKPSNFNHNNVIPNDTQKELARMLDDVSATWQQRQESPGLFLSKFNTAKERVREVLVDALSKEVERGVIDQTTRDDVLNEIAGEFLGHDWSSLKEMLMASKTSVPVLQQFIVIAKLARQDPALYREALLEIGLVPDLVDQVAGIVGSFHDLDSFASLDNEIFELFPDSIFTESGRDLTGDFKRKRERDPFWGRPLKSLEKVRFLESAVKMSQGLFSYVKSFVIKLVGNYDVFIRTKELESAENKAFQKVVSFSGLFDFIGARVVIPGGLSDLEKKADALKDDIRYELQRRINKSTGGVRQTEEKRIRLGEQLEPFIRFDSRWTSGRPRPQDAWAERTTKYYRALHFLIALDNNETDAVIKQLIKNGRWPIDKGVKEWAVEIQVKTFLETVASDLEHALVYKAKEKYKLAETIQRYNWMVNIVESLNYIYEKSAGSTQDAVNKRKELVQFLENKSDSAMKGGIDIRGADASLVVKRDRTNRMQNVLDGGQVIDAGADGYAPFIIEVSDVAGFPFLHKEIMN